MSDSDIKASLQASFKEGWAQVAAAQDSRSASKQEAALDNADWGRQISDPTESRSPSKKRALEESAEGEVLWGRQISAPTGGHSRRRQDVVEIHPDKLQELHLLNSKYLASKYPSDHTEDISDADLQASWGQQGSWTLWSEPPLSAERDMQERDFRVLPPEACSGGDSGRALLRQRGVGAITSKGAKDDSATPGQDNLSVSRLASGWEVFCVMDGHGNDGHWPSTRAVRTLPYFLQSRVCAAKLRSGQVTEAIHHAFEKVQVDLMHHSEKEGVSLLCTGSTAVMAMRHPEKESIWIATAGDSRAALLVPGRGAVMETRDHTPAVEAECQRVKTMGCDVAEKMYEDGYVDRRVCLMGQNYPGLQMTRSLGDALVKDHGVTYEPEIVEWQLNAYPDAILVAATDGIWEFLDTNEVSKIVLSTLGRGHSCQEAAQTLLKLGRHKWFENEGSYCDDISIIVVPLAEIAPQTRAANNPHASPLDRREHKSSPICRLCGWLGRRPQVTVS